MRTHDLPYAIDAIMLNVRADFLERGIIDREGSILDQQAFKTALVSSIKKPITIKRGEDIDRKLAHGHEILTQIRVFLVMADGRPVHAGFRKSKIVLKESETLAEYVIRRVQPDRDDAQEAQDVQFVGDLALTLAQQHEIFIALAHDLVKAQIFDNETPVVAAALRNMLDHR